MDIQKLLSEMTLEEKCSLLSGADFWHTKAIKRLGIPAMMMSDGPHGLRKQDQTGDHLGINDSIKAVCFPTACATAASFDREAVRAIGREIGQACQHEDLGVILGPAVNIKRSPLCGRNFEYFSEDPYLAGEMAVSLIDGVQSQGVGTSIKHFAANSQEHRRMSSDSVIDERTLREIYFPAFEQAVKRAKPWTVMCSYNKLNGTHASQNRELLTGVLREDWGFDGLVMSDWGAVSDRVAGVPAGLDLEMPSSGGCNDRRVMKAVQEGRLSEEAVDVAAGRVLQMVDRYLTSRRPDTPWDKEAQHALARQIAAECMVLLKNEDDILPLHEGEKLAVIGRFAAQPRFQGGGSSHINSFRVESLMDALEGMPGITYAQGYDVKGEEPDEALIAQAVEAAAHADKAVIVAGLPDSFESEGYDRTHMRMPRCQVELIGRVAKVNPNVVVVLYNGSPVEMPWLPCAKAVLEGYLGGQAVGGATRDVLFGTVNPCGCLPESFPVKLEDNPSYLTYGGEGDVAVYAEGVFVGYRYYDRKKMDVLFPFGHGLSYTTFAYTNLRLSADRIRDTDTLTVSVDVTNTGKRAGKTVVQLYVGDRECEVFRPVRELKDFAKISLEPGETKTVTFTLSKRAFAYWNVKLHDWFVESGAFTVEIGRSSRDIALSSEVYVEGTQTVPMTVTPDTIYLDLMKNEKARRVLAPMMEKKRLLDNENGSSSEAAAEAITDEMNEAMFLYSPLRAMVSFDQSMTYDQVQALADEINNA